MNPVFARDTRRSGAGFEHAVVRRIDAELFETAGEATSWDCAGCDRLGEQYSSARARGDSFVSQIAALKSAQANALGCARIACKSS